MPRRMSVRRPAALSLGPAANPRSAATAAPGIPTRDPEQRGHSGRGASGPDPPQSLLDEDAVVVVERHDVGHRAQRDEVE